MKNDDQPGGKKKKEREKKKEGRPISTGRKKDAGWAAGVEMDMRVAGKKGVWGVDRAVRVVRWGLVSLVSEKEKKK